VGKKKFRITRYKINVDKKGNAKLKASKKGYICRERDVAYLEEMLDNKHTTERIARDRADKERRNTEYAKQRLVDAMHELRSMHSIMNDAKNMLRAHGTGDGALIDKIELSVNPVSKWKRIWAIITL
jgi:hypothetical protein